MNCFHIRFTHFNFQHALCLILIRHSCMQGLLQAYSIRHQITTLMNLHASLKKPMTKTTALVLCRHIELLKAIELTFHRRSVLLAETFNHSIQLLCHRAMTVVHTARVSSSQFLCPVLINTALKIDCTLVNVLQSRARACSMVRLLTAI